MTAQISDSCFYDGRRWEVENLNGLTDTIPRVNL